MKPKPIVPSRNFTTSDYSIRKSLSYCSALSKILQLNPQVAKQAPSNSSTKPPVMGSGKENTGPLLPVIAQLPQAIRLLNTCIHRSHAEPAQTLKQHNSFRNSTRVNSVAKADPAATSIQNDKIVEQTSNLDQNIELSAAPTTSEDALMAAKTDEQNEKKEQAEAKPETETEEGTPIHRAQNHCA
ncbi:hypothetical protein KCU78_g605, partial [Aureobasidium melanogenum]